MSTAAPATVVLGGEQAALLATFAPGAGMICCSLRHRGEELLAQNAGLATYAERGKTMGVPLLYPWANRLAGFDYSVAGRTVEVPHDPALIALDDHGLPIHGVIGGRLAWETEPVQPGADSLSARLRWDRSRPEAFAAFPFEHDVEYLARLQQDSIEISISVNASGADGVPVAFGLHPYLSPPGGPREQWLVQLPPMRHLALDSDQIPLGPEDARPAQRLQLDDRSYDDGFDSVAEPARFSVQAGNRAIELELLEGYPCAQVFAPPSGRFICFEPMTAPANALRSGEGLRVLHPGESHRARFSLRIRDLP